MVIAYLQCIMNVVVAINTATVSVFLSRGLRESREAWCDLELGTNHRVTICTKRRVPKSPPLCYMY